MADRYWENSPAPSWREKMAQFYGSFFPEKGNSRYWAEDAAKGAVDFIPGVGDAVSLNDAAHSFDAGEYGKAALEAGGGILGMVPGVGDSAAAALIPAAKKWREMYHATNKSNYFENPIGGINDVGLHVSKHPDVIGQYHGFSKHDEPQAEGMVGGRVYPLLVDPGKVYSGPRVPGMSLAKTVPEDAITWDSPSSVAGSLKRAGSSADFHEPSFFKGSDYMDRLKNAPWMTGVDKDTKAIFDDLYDQRMTPGPEVVTKAFTDRGFDSVLYRHAGTTYDPSAYTKSAMMLFDDKRAIPKFSPQGLAITNSKNYAPASKHLSDPDGIYAEGSTIWTGGPDLKNYGLDENSLREMGWGWDVLNEGSAAAAKKPIYSSKPSVANIDKAVEEMYQILAKLKELSGKSLSP